MSCGNNLRELKLAREYRYLLSNIRPLIEQLDKSKDAQLCLLWLSKLDQCSRYERCERNEILSELSRQVKNRCLEPPFNSQPPPGSLKNIILNMSIPLWRSNDFSDDVSTETATATATATTTELKSPFSNYSNRSSDSREVMQWRGRYINKNVACMNPIKEVKEDHSHCLAMQKKYHDRLVNDQMLIKRYQEIIRSLITKKFKNVESSAVKMKSIKAFYEGKIYDLTASLKMAEEENSNLKEKLSTRVSVSEWEEAETRNSELKAKVGQLEIAKNVLELKCRELEREKNTAVSEMANKLSESEKRLKENDNHLKAMEKKHQETLRTCQEEHREEVSEVEKKYACELASLERMLEEKQSEIRTLRDQVSSQCLHFEDEVMRLKHDILQNSDYEKEKRKVKFLKTRMKKMEKVQENMSTAFRAQLEQVVARKDLFISTLEMKLKAKESEKMRNPLQAEIDAILCEKICHLEGQYRKLLEESEIQAAERRQIDLQKILMLEKKLMDHGLGLQELTTIAYPENLMLTSSQDVEPVSYIEEAQ